MLTDLVDELLNAKTEDQKKKAYRKLERVGVDRISANVMAIGRKMQLEEEKVKK